MHSILQYMERPSDRIVSEDDGSQSLINLEQAAESVPLLHGRGAMDASNRCGTRRCESSEHKARMKSSGT